MLIVPAKERICRTAIDPDTGQRVDDPSDTPNTDELEQVDQDDALDGPVEFGSEQSNTETPPSPDRV